jgi:hypothetical protein
MAACCFPPATKLAVALATVGVVLLHHSIRGKHKAGGFRVQQRGLVHGMFACALQLSEAVRAFCLGLAVMCTL